jgi:hypothetical protein
MASGVKVAYNKENLEYLVKRYSGDPVLFAKEICGYKKLDQWQEWYCNATLTKGQGGKKVAIASCHSSGKTLFSSVIALHRLLCYPESHIVITSATYSQLKSAFHGTLSKVIENSLIANWFDVQAETILLKGVTDSWIKFQPWSLNRPEAFAGIHCASPCFIADESSAIDPLIFQSWDGNMMHENSLLVLLGNPIHRRGELYEAFHEKKDFFETAYVSAYDSSFIDPRWIEEMKATYGEDSDVFRVRVLGEFPQTDTETFIPEIVLRQAVNRAVVPQPNAPIVAGIDIGQYRDQSCMTIRQGNKVLKLLKWQSRDLMIIAEKIHHTIIEYNVRLACIDGNGIGSGVADRLQQLCPEKVFRFKFQNYASTERNWFNSRTKYWGLAKKWLETGSIPEDRDLMKEGPSLLYTFDKLGRFQLESKELAAKRGVDSPDTFDSLAYSFAANPDPTMHLSIGGSTASESDANQITISWY